MMVAGLGCRRGASAEEVEAAILLALARLEPGAGPDSLDALATLAAKATESGLRAAARRLSLPLLACAAEDMRLVLDRVSVLSPRAEEATGLPSVAEAAALAAAGTAARLRVRRVAAAGVTCAIAEGAGR